MNEKIVVFHFNEKFVVPEADLVVWLVAVAADDVFVVDIYFHNQVCRCDCFARHRFLHSMIACRLQTSRIAKVFLWWMHHKS